MSTVLVDDDIVNTINDFFGFFLEGCTMKHSFGTIIIKQRPGGAFNCSVREVFIGEANSRLRGRTRFLFETLVVSILGS